MGGNAAMVRDSGQSEQPVPLAGRSPRTSLLRSASAAYLSRHRDVIYMSPVIRLRRKPLCGIVLAIDLHFLRDRKMWRPESARYGLPTPVSDG